MVVLDTMVARNDRQWQGYGHELKGELCESAEFQCWWLYFLLLPDDKTPLLQLPSLGSIDRFLTDSIGSCHHCASAAILRYGHISERI